MSNRTAGTTSDTFANVYRLCRLNRGNLHFRKQFFRFAGGSIYIHDTGRLVIAREHSIKPAFFANCLLGNGRNTSVDYRRHFIDRCRETDAVRLP